MFKKILPILFAVALPIIIVLPVSAQLSPSRSLGPLGATIDFFGESRAVGASGLGVFPSSGINGNFNYSGGEQFGIYENWSNPTIRSDRWTGQDGPAQEIRREIKGNTLLMRYRREGLVAADEGFVGVQQRMNARNSADIYNWNSDIRIEKK